MTPTSRKPDWLRAKLPSGPGYKATRELVETNKLHTVCQSAQCPNIGECWSRGTATVMILGNICTRSCNFCAIQVGRPTEFDLGEPARVADAVQKMGLRHCVITSVARDDLKDGGASIWAATIRATKYKSPQCAIEVLVPDFKGNLDQVDIVLDAKPDIFNHNVETVERLQREVRDPRAGYEKTLRVLQHAKQHRPQVLTKTSLMLGLGETDEEVLQTMDDLRAIGVDILTLGQYLQPTRNHLPVRRWVSPEEFNRFREIGLEKGFMEVAAGPLVRSSYRADRVFEKNNLGLAAPVPVPGQELDSSLIPALNLN